MTETQAEEAGREEWACDWVDGDSNRWHLVKGDEHLYTWVDAAHRLNALEARIRDLEGEVSYWQDAATIRREMYEKLYHRMQAAEESANKAEGRNAVLEAVVQRLTTSVRVNSIKRERAGLPERYACPICRASVDTENERPEHSADCPAALLTPDAGKEASDGA